MKYRGICTAVFMTLQYIDGVLAPYVPELVGKITGNYTVAFSCICSGCVLLMVAVPCYICSLKPHSLRKLQNCL